ncbi:MAG: hypothetical protein AAGB19_22545, partial [Cyanobacteria bacterium P01_F01_bin.3]
CNPWSGVVTNEIDASLIDLSPSATPAKLEILDIGPLSDVATRASVSTSQLSEVTGRTSGFNAMQVGALAAYYKFQIDGKSYCFKNLFEVESPFGAPGVIKRGDSGAPVCIDGASGKEWAGMIVGRDSFKGYAIFAETVMDWVKSEGYALSVK